MRYDSSNDREQRGHLRDCSRTLLSSFFPFSSTSGRQPRHAPDHKRMHSKQNSCAQTGTMVLSRNDWRQMVQCSWSASSVSFFGFTSLSDGDSDGSSLMRFGDDEDEDEPFIPEVINLVYSWNKIG